MSNTKIALEEHFGIAGFEQYASTAAAGVDQTVMREKLLDFTRFRLPEMDRYGIQTAVLSLTAQGIQAEPDRQRAIDRARQANDYLAHEVIAHHPGRFAGFAALPMQDPAAAADELERAVNTHGFVGAMVHGFSNVGSCDIGEYYDLAKFDVFWERLQALDVPLYIHPRDPLPSQQLAYEGHPGLIGPAWAWGVETATHALRLILGGVFDRFPRVNIILGHLGEMLPFAMYRAGQRLSAPGTKSTLPHPVTHYFQHNFYLTTSGNFRTQALLNSLLEIGADRLMFSVDYPYESTERACEWFDTCPISEVDRRKIASENARRLLRLP